MYDKQIYIYIYIRIYRAKCYSIYKICSVYLLNSPLTKILVSSMQCNRPILLNGLMPYYEKKETETLNISVRSDFLVKFAFSSQRKIVQRGV